MSRKNLVIGAAVLLFVFGSMNLAAQSFPGSSTDPFDSTQGTVVVSHDTLVDPINAFRTSGGFENGNTLMRNGGLNSVSFINFDTASDVSIVGVRLFAIEEYFGPYMGYRRAMNHFKLLADADHDSFFETTVVDTAINPSYAAQPGNVATTFGWLDLTIPSSPIAAKHWRLEVTQGSDLQPYEGARLVEVDAIPNPDLDGDGVLNESDLCPNTPSGTVVNENGCSIAQICPCGSEWNNHGAFVSCVAQTAEAFVAAGSITESEKDAVVSAAAGSGCGKKKK